MSLQSLYVDLNSFFASVEQQLRPELRGRPIGVLPVMADTTCCIAASIDAKRFGIRTGTPVWQARKLCKDIVFVQARPSIYVEIHHRIIAAVESCSPVGEVLSIDEMACELMGSDREEAIAIKLGRQIKRAIYDQVGEVLHSSIGIAPNRFLAKTASNMQQPDGLVVIRLNELPGRLYGLKLGALAGIGGERFYAKFRCDTTAAAPTHRSCVGHSHLLAPELRDPVSALAVLKRLLHKAAMRLRHYGYCAGALSLHLSYLKTAAGHARWVDQARFAPHADTLRFNPVLAELWQRRPPDPGAILKVGVTLSDLVEHSQVTRDLFDPEDQHEPLNTVLDQINQRYGPNTLNFGGAHNSRGAAPMRIAFSHVPELQVEIDG